MLRINLHTDNANRFSPKGIYTRDGACSAIS